LVTKNEKFPAKSGVVSFLDILGTTSILDDRKAQEFLTKINKLYDNFEQLKELSRVLPFLRNTDYTVGNTTVRPYGENGTIPNLELDISTFSDTIILALHGDVPTDSFLLYLVGFFLIPLFRHAFVEEIYLRGTISIGKFFLLKKRNRLLLVGPAVRDAAQSFENTDWIGISTSPSATLTLEQARDLDSILNIEASAHVKGMKGNIDLRKLFHIMKNSFTSYDIPTKTGVEKKGWALSWPVFYGSGELYHTQDEIIHTISKELSYHEYQRTSINKDKYTKFRNTKEFYDFSTLNGELIDCDQFRIASSQENH
jgi:hypothetical protein